MKNNQPGPSIDAEQAMLRVLQAEREAEQAIHDCEIRAQQTIQDARVRSHSIHLRANQRITNTEMRHRQKLDRLIRDLDREGAVAAKHDPGYKTDEEKLLAIVNQLAVELCMD